MSRPPANRPGTLTTAPPLFEFCVIGRPASAQSHNRTRLLAWRQQVRDAATASWPLALAPMTVAVELRITQYSEARVADLDNMVKPIQDALQGIAYVDDKLVDAVTVNWRNINGAFTVRFMPLPIAMAFSAGREFVHIRLWPSPPRKELG